MTHPAERTPLLPCPFCGGKAAIEQHGTMRQSCIIACEDCSCRLETGEVFDMGRAWNTRHSQGESSTEPAAWLVCWHRANGDSGLDAYVNEDAARRAAKNLEAYSASETMADVQPLYTAPTPSPAESSTRLIEIIEALIVSAEQNTDDDGNIYPHAARAIADARKFYREGT